MAKFVGGIAALPPRSAVQHVGRKLAFGSLPPPLRRVCETHQNHAVLGGFHPPYRIVTLVGGIAARVLRPDTAA
jgi:hypothetical protein